MSIVKEEMAPKRRGLVKSQWSPPPDPNGIFRGMVVFLVPYGVQSGRLQVWKQKLAQMGAVVVDNISNRVTHIFANRSNALHLQVNQEHLRRFKGSLLLYQWLENCLKLGERVPEDPYVLKFQDIGLDELACKISPVSSEATVSDDESLNHKRFKASFEDSNIGEGASKEENTSAKDNLDNQDSVSHGGIKGSPTGKGPSQETNMQSEDHVSSLGLGASGAPNKKADASELQSPYNPPDFNRNITEIFGKLINIYRALGDERRSFSYYKAIPVIEKLPFRIESVDQVKNLPTIGKSLQDHIHEIITTGKLSKLEHFENDEKIRTVNLFGEVWGIGPTTALKLYEKGYRTLDDLKHDDSLTTAQKIGLKYFDDIKKRIPRHEVKDMEALLQKDGQEVLPGVIIVCGGSYRRGKASCGDLDIVITHPDGKSHKGFLPRYVQFLKKINFLREDLIFSIHSTEGTDAGIDTYFGLCTYPGRELRHRIDIKVYPKDRYAFGLIAWTGNDVLNRRLRLLAESKGYRLDDTGLYLATRGSPGRRGAKSGTIMPCNTEKDVFDALGFPWLGPHERNL